jgi:ATP-dependent 26S proteasome regulatory subunit
LEYYDGILILTTNRLKTFDHAVMSRINLPIKYPPLDYERKKKIFHNLLNNLSNDGVTSKPEIFNWLDDDESEAMQKFESLNGRQIRNLLFSATSIAAEQDSAKLELEDIEKLAGVMHKFQEDIRADMEYARRVNEPRAEYNLR